MIGEKSSFGDAYECRQMLEMILFPYDATVAKVALMSLIAQVLALECETAADAERLVEAAREFLRRRLAEEMVERMECAGNA